MAIAFVSAIAESTVGDTGWSIVVLVAVLAFVAGSAYAITAVSAQTALFENMPAGVRGRVFGVLASIVSAASLVPILVAGPLADQISGATVIALAAIGVLLVAGWSATLFGPRSTAMPGEPLTGRARVKVSPRWIVMSS